MTSLIDRLTSAGIQPEARAQALLATGWVRVDGDVMTEPATPIADVARIVLLEPTEVTR